MYHVRGTGGGAWVEGAEFLVFLMAAPDWLLGRIAPPTRSDAW